MPKYRKETKMKELLERCCGIDIHKKTAVACIMLGSGKKIKKEIRTFGTMTSDIKDLKIWLKQNKIKHVAIESTGIYWKPIFNVLEDDFEIVLANAKHIKNVPGRKTDVKDSEWLCKLLKNGLIAKSFIPPEDIRHLRELTRYRKSLLSGLTAAKNRVVKTLESANVKLASVLSNVHGATGWKIIKELANGEQSVKKLISNLSPRVKASKEQFEKALENTLKTHNRELLKVKIRHIENLQKLISEVEEQIKTLLKKYSSEILLLRTIPGMGETIAAITLAEIGADMNQFPSDMHIASWAGLAPGNNESAGKKKVLESLKEIKT